MKRALAFVVLLSLSSVALADSSAATHLHAFTPPAGDAAVGFLREVFGSVIDSIAASGSASSDGSAGKANSTLGAMLQPFNTAVLFVGLLYMVYTTIKGTVDSAHDGEILGSRMSSVWVPIRAVGASGMLLPVASGYSLVQVMMLWFAIQGVGIGDAVLSAGLDYVAETNMVSVPNIPSSRELGANILRAETCAAAMNQQYQASGRTTRITEQEHTASVTNAGEVGAGSFGQAAVAGVVAGPLGAIASVANDLSNATYAVTEYAWSANDGSYMNPNVCGSLTWQESAESAKGGGSSSVSKATLMRAQEQAVRQMIADLRPVADKIVAGQKPTVGALDAAVNRYQKTLTAAAKTALSTAQNNTRADFINLAKASGWIFIPVYYHHLIQLNDDMQAALNSLPQSSPITIDDKEVGAVLTNYHDALLVVDAYSRNSADAVQQAYDEQAEADVKIPRSWADLERLLSRPAQGAINKFTQLLAGSNLSHVGQVKAVGDTIVGGAEAVVATMFTVSGVGDSNASKLTIGNIFNIGSALASISGVLTAIVMIVLGAGLVCSYYVPMIPYICGVSAVVKWLVLCFESVIAAQIWGVAHAHPEGHDAVGQAGPGYMLALGLTLRPALTVLGFFGSIWLAQPITGFVNLTYMTAVSSAEHNSFTGLVGFMAYVAIYALIMTTVIHSVFALTNWVPDNVLRWIGGRLTAEGVADREPGEAAHRFEDGVKTARQGIGQGAGRAAAEAANLDKPTGGAAGSGQTLTDLMPNNLTGGSFD
ncbi:DotA/TraY family protein [Burkholderia cenocepacia]|uniref:DotA/TraY family protein n=1 Tax=Burkholderia cenocepacia TaxID=95486 RepID=UPI001BA13308|nr:DotA/TraY family protein [Burkholderia cenocepacia]MBR8029900.1 DotA/TraY family protein [Burkholderia cenocepacia]MBR8173692.1 DotA/TraY family protein [Burkholderia cenocepacia]